jgi:hypothetical protein
MLESEQDTSIEGDGSISDPFLMPSASTRASVVTIKPRQAIADESDDTEEEGSLTASESESDAETDEEDDEEAVIATLTPDVRYQSQTQRQPVAAADADISIESEDPLATMDDLEVSLPAVDDSEEEEEEEDDMEEDVTDEEEEEEVGEADEEDAAEAESSFAASASTGSVSDFGSDKLDSGSDGDSDDSALGRSAARRRKTGSPIEKTRPSASVSKAQTQAKRASAIKAKPTTKATPVKVKSPLQERSAQETVESDEDEIVAIKTPLKKKR